MTMAGLGVIKGAGWVLWGFQEEDVLLVFLREVLHSFVERSEDQTFLYGGPKQIGIRDLVVPMDAFGEGFGQSVPVCGDGLVAIAWLLFQSVEHGGDLLHAEIPGLWPGKVAQYRGFGEGTERPPQPGCIEPSLDDAVMNVCLIEQSQKDVCVRQVHRLLSQGRPR
jgi:hypothetical protein